MDDEQLIDFLDVYSKIAAVTNACKKQDGDIFELRRDVEFLKKTVREEQQIINGLLTTISNLADVTTKMYKRI